MADAIRVTDIGATALRLVGDAVSPPSPVAALSRSLYLDVGGEIVWLGPPGGTLHARAMLAESAPRDGSAVRLDVTAARVWRPAVLPDGVARDTLRRSAGALARASARLGRPDGFGALLAGAPPAFPLAGAADGARAFLAACAAGDAAGATALAEPLLGLGPGLTPAGDDLVGGAGFARRTLATVAGDDDMPWRDAADAIRALAAHRTHRISAALLGDLLDGDAYAPLHDLAAALARDDAAGGIDAAARLVRIGHSSGWDLLTGFLAALGAGSAAS